MMKKKYFLNANIIDPKNGLEEIGGLIVNEEGKIEAVGKKVNKNNIPSRWNIIFVYFFSYGFNFTFLIYNQATNLF